MMDILILSGGGSSDGTTAGLAEMAAAGFRAEGADVGIVDLAACDIGYCTGCNECRDTGRCRMRDDMDVLIPRSAACDVLVIATPVRFNGSSSVTKRFVERFQPYWFAEHAEHPGTMTAIVCGGSANPNFKNVVSEFKALRSILGRRWSEELRIAATDDNGLEAYRDACTSWARDTVRRHGGQ